MNRRVAVIALVAILGSCVSTFAIRASGDPNSPLFVIEQEITCSGGSGEILVERLTEEGGRLATSPVWRAQKQREPRFARLRQFSYGVLPSGFRELVPSAPLEPGQKYAVHLRCSPASGMGVFRIRNAAGTLEIENID